MFRFNPCKNFKKKIRYLLESNSYTKKIFKIPDVLKKRKNYRFCCLLFFHMKKSKKINFYLISLKAKREKIVSLIPSDMFNQNPESNRNSTLMFIKSKNKCKRTNIQRIPFGHRFPAAIKSYFYLV